MYLIGTEKECLDYDKYVSEMRGFTGNVTARWAEPRKHPKQDLYAIIVDDANPPLSGDLVEALSEDWRANMEDEFEGA